MSALESIGNGAEAGPSWSSLLGPVSEDNGYDESPRERSARGQVYRRLRRAIILGKIPPGHSLSEKELAGILGVSRTPVREALQRLSDDDLVIVRPQQGTETSRISVRRVREAQFVRELLERSALKLIFERDEPLPMASLQNQITGQVRAINEHDFAGFFESDQRFHRVLSALSGYDSLGRIADTARAHLDRVRALSLPEPKTMQRIVHEHELILEHLDAGQRQEADEVMRGHLRSVLQVLPKMSRRYPDYFAPEADDGGTIELVALDVALHHAAG